jgi:glycosyltransferase involved in cell wall biosynthesis
MSKTPKPLVSIISFCKNRVRSVQRSVDSVLSQSYRHLELVVQDGASTDGTLEILRRYDDPRIKLISEPDSGPAEAFWRVINRCEGDIIGTCLSDEELLPGAIERAVEFFCDNPGVGAMTCDGYVTDSDGKITGNFVAGEFNLVDYLFSNYCPFWPGSFFRRSALLDVGLRPELRDQWTVGSLEFEIWCRLGTRHSVKYVPIPISKYAINSDQLSNTPRDINEHLNHRAIVVEAMFSKAGFFGDADVKKRACLYNQYYLFYNHARAYKLFEPAKEIYHRIRATIDSLSVTQRIDYQSMFSTELTELTDFNMQISIYARFQFFWMYAVGRLPRSVAHLIPAKTRSKVREYARITFVLLFTYLARLRLAMQGRADQQEGKNAWMGLTAQRFSKALYADTAQVFYARGQIEEALLLWRSAEDLEDPRLDALACQAMLLSPTATNSGLLDAHLKWADRHAQPDPSISDCPVRPFKGDRKIRVGYHCAFMDSDTIRSIMSSVIKSRDRDKFEAYGYAVTAIASDLGSAFDVFRNTCALKDKEFVELIRADQIDIFVELTGFSPHNRFSAMASRCAPIQISYLNHTSTSGVRNVDYIFADATSVQLEDDQFFTETVWRLPGSFLSYVYDSDRMPPITPAPFKRNGFVTFGHFGSGGKVNDQLISIWAGVMQRVAGSQIYLRNFELSSENNRKFMSERFERHGIDAGRIRIAAGADRETILKCYAEVDIALDTWPYCGGNTTAESLFQGVPVITLKGDRFSGRYGASLLLAAGCPELVAENVDQYIQIAESLSSTPEKLDYYRKNLRRLCSEYGLSDSKQFARKLDFAYSEMMKLRQGLC